MLWLFSLLLLAWYFFNSLQAKERALVIVKQHCNNLNLQILDEAVINSKARLQRDYNGKLKLKRQFEFEFTATGAGRYHGQLILLGNIVQDISIEPFAIDITTIKPQ